MPDASFDKPRVGETDLVLVVNGFLRDIGRNLWFRT